jgi:hypothetical protein
MILIKPDKTTEAGGVPDEKFITEMRQFNQELVKAAVMIAGEGLHPSSKGARVKFSGVKRTVIDGPFAEAKELIAVQLMSLFWRGIHQAVGFLLAPLR